MSEHLFSWGMSSKDDHLIVNAYREVPEERQEMLIGPTFYGSQMDKYMEMCSCSYRHRCWDISNRHIQAASEEPHR